MKRQTFTSPNKWYQLEYSRMWEMEVVEGIPVFFDPISGMGGLQLFAISLAGEVSEKITKTFSFLRGKSLDQKMFFFLEAQKVGIGLEDIKLYDLGDFQMVASEYTIEDTFYMAVMKQKNDNFILALYNCKGTPTKEEAGEIGKIVESIIFI